MGTIASQITSFTTVYSTVYSGADQKRTSKLRVTGLCVGNSPGTGEFPAQMASNAENVSIWWRHHVIIIHYWQVCVLTVIALLGISTTVPQHKVLQVLTEQGLGRSPYFSSWILNPSIAAPVYIRDPSWAITATAMSGARHIICNVQYWLKI